MKYTLIFCFMIMNFLNANTAFPLIEDLSSLSAIDSVHFYEVLFDYKEVSKKREPRRVTEIVDGKERVRLRIPAPGHTSDTIFETFTHKYFSETSIKDFCKPREIFNNRLKQIEGYLSFFDDPNLISNLKNAIKMEDSRYEIPVALFKIQNGEEIAWVYVNCWEVKREEDFDTDCLKLKHINIVVYNSDFSKVLANNSCG